MKKISDIIHFQFFLKYFLVILTALVMASPIFMLLNAAVKVDFSIWAMLWQTRLPGLFLNSFLLVITVTVGSLILGFFLAWLIERTDLPFRRWLKPLLVTPLIIPCYIIAICYISFFGVQGLCEKMLRIFSPEITIPNIYGFWGATLVLIIGTYPYVYTILSAAMRNMDPTLSEAAKCLGAGRYRRFFFIMIPVLTPAFTAGATLVALYVLSDFGVVSLLRYKTFINTIYEQISGRYSFDIASALSLILVILTIFFLFIQETVSKKKRYFTSSPQRGNIKLIRLKAFKYPALIFIFMIILLGLVIPLGILLYWSFQSGKTEGILTLWNSSFLEVIRSGINSLVVSTFAATLTIILALPLSYWTIRQPQNRTGWICSWMAQSGVALPGVLIALGISLVFLKFLPKLNYSIFAIVVAFMIHFFAQGYQALRSGLTQISISLEESARLLGFSVFKTFWYITRPLLSSSLWAGWILIFLSSMRELPASLLLRPAGFDTLTVKVWIAASEGFYEQAAKPALMLVVLSLPFLYTILYQAKEERYACD